MEKKIIKTEKVSYGDKISDFKFSKVDILIPFHGQYNKVRNLVQSIFNYTKSNPYLVCLIDDASPNDSFLQTIKNQVPLKAIRNDKQMGFAGALKAGFDKTTNPFVVVMHSDCTVVDPNWLLRLGESLLKLSEQRVGLVHTRTNNPMCDNPYLPATKQEQNCDDVIVKDEEPLPLISAMMHRDLFKHIGGFLKEYPYGWYENIELFYRMKKFNIKQAVCGKSWVNHIGGSTMNELMKNKKIKKIIENNYELCIKDIS